MQEPAAHPVAPDRLASLERLTHIIYGLHAVSVLTGVFGAVSVIGAFLVGWPSIIAVIINYVKRPDVAGTWLESHFRWQIRTFWFVALWFAVGCVLFVTVIGIPLAILIFVAETIWLIYRVARGWLALNDRKAMEI